MKQKYEFEADQLKKYLKGSDTEKAPEGFTDKLMIQVNMETSKTSHLFVRKNRSLVPCISAGITVLLILTALLLPGAESVTPFFNRLGKLDQINSILTEIRFEWTFFMSLPEIAVYVTVSIFLLLIFDRSVSRLFRHET